MKNFFSILLLLVMVLSLSVQVAEQMYSVVETCELEESTSGGDAEELEKTNKSKDIFHFKLKFYADYQIDMKAKNIQSPFFYNTSWTSQLFKNLPELPPEV